MISDTSLRGQVFFAVPLTAAFMEENSLGVVVLLGIFTVFSRDIAIRLMQNVGVDMKNNFGVLGWDLNISCRSRKGVISINAECLFAEEAQRVLNWNAAYREGN